MFLQYTIYCFNMFCSSIFILRGGINYFLSPGGPSSFFSVYIQKAFCGLRLFGMLVGFLSLGLSPASEQQEQTAHKRYTRDSSPRVIAHSCCARSLTPVGVKGWLLARPAAEQKDPESFRHGAMQSAHCICN